jgi:deoxyribonuclease V
MKARALHSWHVTAAKAVEIQKQLSSQVVRRDMFSVVKRVCGVDVSFKAGQAIAACVVMNYPDFEVVETSVHRSRIVFPYIPGLLSFREIPALLPAVERIESTPDLVIADGQGIAHVRGMGLASHLGMVVGIPTIGCAKSRLLGSYRAPGPLKGDWEYLYKGKDVIGAVLRTRQGVKPLFVSIGNGISLHSALYYVLTCCARYRITEPIRVAHKLAGGST